MIEGEFFISSMSYKYAPENYVFLYTGDTIVRKIRKYRGHFQYRHWNISKKKWVESQWIDM